MVPDKAELTGRPVAGSNAWPVVGLIGKPVKGSILNPVLGSVARPGLVGTLDDPVLMVGGTTDPVNEAAGGMTGRPVAGSTVGALIGRPVEGSIWRPDPPAGKVETEVMGTLSGGLLPALILALLASTGGGTKLEDDPGVKAGDATVVMLAKELIAVVTTVGGITTAVAEAPELRFTFSKASASSGVSKTVTLWTLRLISSLTDVAGSRFT